MTAESNVRRWVVAVVAAVIVMGLIVTVSFFVADRISGGPSARRAAEQSAAECVTAYRGEWQNAIGDIVLVAARGNDPAEWQVRALAQAQRHSLRINDLCDPTQPGGVQLPAPADP
jgi:hypothetical protein